MTAAQIELITAAVDGELSPSEVGAFRVLLSSSAAARELFGQLKADSLRVNALPRVAPPADLRAKILARLAEATPTPRIKLQFAAESSRKSASIPRSTRRFLRWAPVWVAASVFLCITVGSFAFFWDRGGAKNQLAKNTWENVLPAPREVPPAIPSPNAVPFERPDPVTVVRLRVLPVPPALTPHEVAPATVAVAPAPRALDPDYIASPFRTKIPPFERIEVRVPFLRSVADLGREDIEQELLVGIGRDPVRFDLFVRDTARGVEVFQNVAKICGIALHLDAATLDKLKKKQAHAVVIYTESLSAVELVALFGKFSAEDAKYSPRVCDSLHATTVARADEIDLKAILGHDVGLYKRPTGTRTGAGQGGERVAPGKSINVGTIDQVVQSISGSLSSATTKVLDKHAVLLTWQTIHPTIFRTNPSHSQELMQYCQKRGERRSNAVPAIIVIRLINKQ